MRLALSHLTLDLATREVLLRDGGRSLLTGRELALLRYLLARSDSDVERAVLERDVLGIGKDVLSRALDATVARLRRKLEPTRGAPRHLLTVHGTGYRWASLREDAALTPPAPVRPPRPRLGLGDGHVDLEQGWVERAGRRCLLTPTERLVLERLAEADGPVAPEALLPGSALDGARRLVRERVAKTVHRLRQKLEPVPRRPRYLVSVRDLGYRLHVAPLREPLAEKLRSLAFAVARHAGQTLQLSDVVVYLREGDRLRQLGAHGPKSTAAGCLVEPLVLSMGQGIVGSVAARGRTELIGDTSKDRRYVRDALPGLSELAVPVLLDGEVVAVVDSEDPRPRAFRDEHRAALESLGSVLASSVRALSA